MIYAMSSLILKHWQSMLRDINVKKQKLVSVQSSENLFLM